MVLISPHQFLIFWIKLTNTFYSMHTMAQKRSIFANFIINIAIVSLVSFSTRTYGRDLNDHNNHMEEETGNYLEAYPSYNRKILIDGVSLPEFDNSTIALETGTDFDVLEMFPTLSLANTINVDSFGAKGDGIHDDTKAFQDAWKQACSSTASVTFVVSPGKTYHLKPLTFSGPCKSQITVQIYGTLQASENTSDYGKDARRWIIFDTIQNLIVQGGGLINGKGNIWWKNSCKINKALPCKHAPTAITFNKCQKLIVQNLKIQDSQQMHVSFDACENVQASHLVVTAPGNSPNTDGIHVTDTKNIQISDCTIGTGDDCISISSGSQIVQITDVTCGPGHGISIGSLGEGNSAAHVSGVTVNRAKISGATNGVRIKTYQGGSGSASNITFQNVEMQNVANPIIVDQNYCDRSTCPKQHSAVQVSDVVYRNIKGTSASDIAINFDCSISFPCKGIVLENVELVGKGGGATKASCNNINLKNIGTVSPRCN